MDLSGIPKLAYRSRWMQAYRKLSGNNFIPRDEVIFTLGGLCGSNGELIIDSELDQLLTQSFDKMSFILPRQYVSVERDAQIHAENEKLRGHYLSYNWPIWLKGDLLSRFQKWNKAPCAIVHADLMCGVDAGLPTILGILDAALQSKRVPRCGATLFVFNVQFRNILREIQGNISNLKVRETIEYNSTFKRIKQQYKSTDGSLEFIDGFRYNNKVVGGGARVVTMETIMYWG